MLQRLKAMRPKMSHLAGAVALASLLGVYQNCAQAPDSSAGLSSEDYEDGLPFAYDVKLDTVAYMSCTNVDPTKTPGDDYMKRAFFTFRAGAYNSNTGGIALTKDFRTMTQYYSSEERARAMASSALSGNTRLTMSMRFRSHIQDTWGQGSTKGYRQSGFLPPMDSAEVAGPLAASVNGLAASQSRYLNYFPGALDKRLVEASLLTMGSYADTTALQKKLSGLDSDPTYLVAAFGATSDEMSQALRQPITYALDKTTVLPTDSTKALGVGLNVRFAAAAGVGTVETRVLNGVDEVDLATGSPKYFGGASSQWTCPASYQFMIVRPEDIQANPNLCFTGPDQPVGSDPALQSAQNAIRRVLRTEDWYVDVRKKCVVQKANRDVCYGNYGGTATSFVPMYYYNQCVRDTTVASGTIPAGTTCPHYVSVCIRQ